MYGQGNGTPQVLGTTATIAGVTVLPQTGMNSVVEIALALAAGLAVWAIAYTAMLKFSKR